MHNLRAIFGEKVVHVLIDVILIAEAQAVCYASRKNDFCNLLSNHSGC